MTKIQIATQKFATDVAALVREEVRAALREEVRAEVKLEVRNDLVHMLEVAFGPELVRTNVAGNIVRVRDVAAIAKRPPAKPASPARAGLHDTIYKIIRSSGTKGVKLAGIVDALPGYRKDALKEGLQTLKAEGQIVARGNTRAARWHVKTVG